ncbi:MAG: hypothetical protein ACE5JR_06265 [Gemmatimonadota bacterium]
MRTVGSVVLGYVVIFALVFITFSLAYGILGADGAFRPGSYEISGLWIAVSIALGFIAAGVGGFVCLAVGRTPRAPKFLAALVLGLGLLMAIPAFAPSDEASPKAREADVGNIEAMQNSEQPAWLALFNPVIGAAGVLAGARLKKRPTSEPPAA